VHRHVEASVHDVPSEGFDLERAVSYRTVLERVSELTCVSMRGVVLPLEQAGHAPCDATLHVYDAQQNVHWKAPAMLALNCVGLVTDFVNGRLLLRTSDGRLAQPCRYALHAVLHTDGEARVLYAVASVHEFLIARAMLQNGSTPFGIVPVHLVGVSHQFPHRPLIGFARARESISTRMCQDIEAVQEQEEDVHVRRVTAASLANLLCKTLALLQNLRDRYQFVHNDLRLDNVLLHPHDDDDVWICDLEFARIRIGDTLYVRGDLLQYNDREWGCFVSDGDAEPFAGVDAQLLILSAITHLVLYVSASRNPDSEEAALALHLVQVWCLMGRETPVLFSAEEMMQHMMLRMSSLEDASICVSHLLRCVSSNNRIEREHASPHAPAAWRSAILNTQRANLPPAVAERVGNVLRWISH